jgi:hypothetical protein
VTIDELWSAYARTLVTVHGPTGSFEVHPAQPGQSGTWPSAFQPPLYIITAWDPGDDRPGDEVNRRRQAALEEDLRQLDVTTWPAIGSDPETGHREEGVVVSGLSEPQAFELGRRYDQDAIFNWTPADWVILSCGDDRRHELGWLLRTLP